MYSVAYFPKKQLPKLLTVDSFSLTRCDAKLGLECLEVEENEVPRVVAPDFRVDLGVVNPGKGLLRQKTLQKPQGPVDSNSPALAPCRDISIALEDKERNICLGVVLVGESGRCMLSWNVFTHLPEAVGQAQPHNSCADNDDGLCRHPSRRDQVSTIMSKSLLFVLGPAFTD